MGRKLNISQPAVIQTELRPLDENFWIDANGSLEQWYYQNTNVFAPDRQVTPLILTPYLSVIDRDTNITYVPNSSNNWVKKVVGQEPEVIPNSSAFQLDHWEVKEYVDGAWVTTTITSQSQNENYVLSGLNIIVRKNNYDATHAITITCKATYNDPRDAGAQHGVQESAMLVTSVDATQAFPKIDIVNPATRTYNPLKDKSSVFEFEGKADWDGVEAQGGTAITECKVDPLGTEQILPTNDEMVLNAAPTLNIHYGDIEKSNQKFMYRQTANGEVSEIVGGVSAIDNIKGNTVVWNQLAKRTDLLNEVNGTKSVIRYGEVLLTPSTDQNNCGLTDYTIKVITGHKYYLSAFVKTATTGNYPFLFASWATGGPYYVDITANNYSKLAAVATADSDEYLAVAKRLNIEPFYVKDLEYIDLTLMFGAGNEPSTVAEFETWLANNVGLKDYYEYCSGKLVNFGGYGVKWNQLIPNDSIAFTKDTQGDSDLVKVSCTANHKYLFLGRTNRISANTFDEDYQIYCLGAISAYNINGRTTSYRLIETASTSGDLTVSIMAYSQFGGKVDGTLNLIDLTLMFGAGNEPDLEWCEKYFSKDYYPYCPSVEKNILDVMTTKEVVDGVAQYKSPEMGIKTTGFNQWDEEISTKPISQVTGEQMGDEGTCVSSLNYIPVLPNTDYYVKCKYAGTSGLYIKQFDSGKSPISDAWDFSNKSNTTITTSQNAYYIKFMTLGSYGTTYNHDICINISNPSKNGTYEPYWSANRNLDWISKIGIKNFNIWDEVIEGGSIDNTTGENAAGDNNFRSKSFIPVSESTQYCLSHNIEGISTSLDIIYYDSSRNLISYTNISGAQQHPVSTFTTPVDTAYIRVSAWGQSSGWGTSPPDYDICINESVDGMNGMYVPYGETAPYFGDGLKSAGSVHDEIKVEDGVVKAIKRIGSVDLGTLGWISADYYQTGGGASYISYVAAPSNAKPGVYAEKANIIASKGVNTESVSLQSKSWEQDNYYITNAENIEWFFDVAKTAQEVISYLNGVILYYELETPYEFEIDYPTKGQFMWYGVDGSNNEVPIDQLPIYSQATQPSGYGQGTSRININALYGENIPVMLRVKRYPWSPTVLPPKVTKSVAWSVPPIDVVTTCDKGSAVRATNADANFIFGTIVNQQGDVISEEKKEENMVFDWYMVKYGTSGAVKTSQGSGLTKSIPASTLKNATPNGGVTPSTNVYCEAFLLGAYHLVDGQYVRTKD